MKMNKYLTFVNINFVMKKIFESNIKFNIIAVLKKVNHINSIRYFSISNLIFFS